MPRAQARSQASPHGASRRPHPQTLLPFADVDREGVENVHQARVELKWFASNPPTLTYFLNTLAFLTKGELIIYLDPHHVGPRPGDAYIWVEESSGDAKYVLKVLKDALTTMHLPANAILGPGDECYYDDWGCPPAPPTAVTWESFL
jgi:hypothetical protein